MTGSFIITYDFVALAMHLVKPEALVTLLNISSVSRSRLAQCLGDASTSHSEAIHSRRIRLGPRRHGMSLNLSIHVAYPSRVHRTALLQNRRSQANEHAALHESPELVKRRPVTNALIRGTYP